MGLKSEDLRPIFDEVVGDYSLVYDIGVTTPPEDLIRQRVQDHCNSDYKSHPAYDKECFIDESVKTVIVWNVFSIVAFDYTFRDVFIPQIIDKLNLKYGQEDIYFAYDNYLLNRKQFAVRSGTAKISRPSIAFHEKFGLNYKIDLLFTNAVFEDSVIMDDMLKYDILFVGSDWHGDEKWVETEYLLKERGSKIVYFPYTKSISSNPY